MAHTDQEGRHPVSITEDTQTETCGYCGKAVKLSPSGLYQLAGEAGHDLNDECRACTVCSESPDNRHDPEGDPDWVEPDDEDEDDSPAKVGQCVYCLHRGPAVLFEDINDQGNQACKAVAACEVRQESGNPAEYLARLLRAVRRELVTLSVDDLATLAIDLKGFPADVNIQLSCHADSAAALERVQRDRAERKERQVRIDLSTGRPI